MTETGSSTKIMINYSCLFRSHLMNQLNSLSRIFVCVLVENVPLLWSQRKNFSVLTNGKSIEEKHKEKIFQKFPNTNIPKLWSFQVQWIFIAMTTIIQRQDFVCQINKVRNLNQFKYWFICKTNRVNLKMESFVLFCFANALCLCA